MIQMVQKDLSNKKDCDKSTGELGAIHIVAVSAATCMKRGESWGASVSFEFRKSDS